MGHTGPGEGAGAACLGVWGWSSGRTVPVQEMGRTGFLLGDTGSLCEGVSRAVDLHLPNAVTL